MSYRINSNYSIIKDRNPTQSLDKKTIDDWINSDKLVSCDIEGKLGNLIAPYLSYTKNAGQIDSGELIELINKAYKEKWKILDLSCMRIGELPENLWKLSELEVLILGKVTDENDTYANRFKNITVLDKDGITLSNLKILMMAGSHLKKLPDKIIHLKNLELITFSMKEEIALSLKHMSILDAELPKPKSISIQTPGRIHTHIYTISSQSRLGNAYTKSDYDSEQLWDLFKTYNSRIGMQYYLTQIQHPEIKKPELLSGRIFNSYEPDEEAKIVVFGPRGFGKSSLITGIFPENQNITDKDIKNEFKVNYYTYDGIENEIIYRLNIWEYSVHENGDMIFPLLFTEPVLYLFVWSNGIGAKPDDIKRWFDKIRLENGQARVIFVITHDDDYTASGGYYEAIIGNLLQRRNDLQIEIYYVGRTNAGIKSNEYDYRMNEIRRAVDIYARDIKHSIAFGYKGLANNLRNYLQNTNEMFIFFPMLVSTLGCHDERSTRQIIKELHETGAINNYNGWNTDIDNKNIIILDLNCVKDIYLAIIDYCTNRRPVITSEQFSEVLFSKFLGICPSYAHGSILKDLVDRGLLINQGADLYFLSTPGYRYLEKNKVKEYKKLIKSTNPFLNKTLHSHYQYTCKNVQDLFDSFFTDDKAVRYDDDKGFVFFDKTDVMTGDVFIHIIMTGTGEQKEHVDIEIYTYPGIVINRENPLIGILRDKMNFIHRQSHEKLSLQICCGTRYEWQNDCERVRLNKERCKWDYFNIKKRNFTYFDQLLCLNCPENTFLSDVLYLDLI